ncbi:hypothetical protein [Streptomyces decoyicus]|uniref:hypothetical protein n=1 Tax=Streptomyces decoyicus TaxID=249567 RepID=UPI00381D6FAA
MKEELREDGGRDAPRSERTGAGHGQRQLVDVGQVQVVLAGMCPGAARSAAVGVGAGDAGDAEDGTDVQSRPLIVRATSGSRSAARSISAPACSRRQPGPQGFGRFSTRLSP